MNQPSAPAIIRDAVPSDAESIARIYNHYVYQGGSTFDHQPWSIDTPAKLLASMDRGVWLVAIEDDGLAGWASARRFSDRFGFRYSLELAIYTDHQVTQRGIGSLLFEEIERRCRQQDVHHLVSRVIAGNQASLRFHERQGFSVVGVQNEIGRMNEQWVDLVILQKLLK